MSGSVTDALLAGAESVLSRFAPEPGGFLVAFSGGADSRTALSVCQRLAAKRGVPLAAVHVNHGIRGAEADRDEAFCRAVCREENIPFFCRRCDVPAEAARTGQGLEETARRMRYRFFAGICRENPSYTYLVTAHTATDLLETQIFRLCRGSGTLGMAGIPPRRGKIVRPLITATREEILEYIRENGLSYVTDSTNADVAYSRNRIRQTVLPELRKLNPKLEAAALRLAESARRDSDCLDGMAREYLASHPMPLFCRELLAQPAALRCRILREAFDGRPDFSCEEAIAAVLSSSEPRRIPLPGGGAARVERGLLYYEASRTHIPFFSMPLAPGLNPLPDGRTFLLVSHPADVMPDKNVYKLSMQARVNSATMRTKLFARQRQPGDLLFRGGMNRRVKKLLCDAGLTQEERDRLPVICDGEGILYLPGFGQRDGTAPHGDETDLVLSVLEKSELPFSTSYHTIKGASKGETL